MEDPIFVPIHVKCYRHAESEYQYVKVFLIELQHMSRRFVWRISGVLTRHLNATLISTLHGDKFVEVAVVMAVFVCVAKGNTCGKLLYLLNRVVGC